MNIYEIRYGNTTEVVEADARGIRSGRIPPAVRDYATVKLDYLVRHGAPVSSVEVSLLVLTNVSTGSEGVRQVLGVITADQVTRDTAANGWDVIGNGPALG